MKLIKKHKIITTLAFACVLSLSVLSPTYAIEYSGIGGKPAFPRSDNPRTESVFIHTAQPGTLIDEAVTVVNNTNETKTLMVYPVDSIVSTGGNMGCAQKDDTKKDVGLWTSMEKSEVTLKAFQTENVKFTINIPQSAGVGEHNGCIIIQEKKESSNQQGINISFRQGLRVALTVPGDIIKDLNIVDLKINDSQDKIVINPQVKNNGNVSVDTDVKVSVKNVLGAEVYSNGGTYSILRDQISDWNFEYNKPFWGGLYTVQFTADYDSDPAAELGKTANTTTASLKKHLESKTVTFVTTPRKLAMVIYLIGLIVLMTIIYSIYRMLRFRNSIKNRWIKYEVKDGEDLNSIAKKAGLQWRLMAMANKLKAPYTLKEGQIIKVPPYMKTPKSVNGDHKIIKKIKKKIKKTKSEDKSKPVNQTVKIVKMTKKIKK